MGMELGGLEMLELGAPEIVVPPGQPGPQRFAKPIDWALCDIKILAAEEYHLLATVPPFDTVGVPAPDAGTFVVAIVNNEIIAYWSIFLAVHVEPMWIKEEHRSRVGLIRRLWNGVLEVLDSFKVLNAFATIKYADVLQSLPAALRLGFKRYYGDLYTINVAEANRLGGIRDSLSAITHPES